MKILTESQASRTAALAVIRLADFLQTNQLKAVVLGISGGIDSAVVAVLGLEAVDLLASRGYPVSVRYVFLDADSALGDFGKATDLAIKFDFKLGYLDLTKWYETSPLIGLIPEGHGREKVARGNIKCRLRMISLYHLAQLEGGVYLDTDDLSEEYMGFWTKHGDEGDVKIIQHLTKDEVYDLGEYLGIPESILSAPPGDGLKVTPTSAAEDQLGLPYLMTDYIMSRFVYSGFDHNGSLELMGDPLVNVLINDLATELDRPRAKIEAVIVQALRTAYKRKYGDNVLHLLPSRAELGLPSFGTREFNELYLTVIKSS